MTSADLYFLFRNITITLAALMLVKYVFFLVIAPFHPVKEARRALKIARQRKKDGYSYHPVVSVLVPAWNEEVGIVRTIRSILESSYDNIELVVVNDGSSDRTGARVKSFFKSSHCMRILAKHPKKRVRYFRKANGGKGTALNYGVEHSTGEIVLTVDADSALETHAIERLVGYFEDPAVDAVVGRVEVGNNPSLIGFIQKLEYMFGFYYKRAHSVLGAEYVFGGACAAFRRKTVFDEIGLYDTRNKTEDIELTVRCRYFGKKCVYGEDIVAYTEGASDVIGLLSQRLRWKKGRFDTLIKYRSLFFSTKKHHNKFLSWFVFPYLLLQEIQLFFEPIGFTLLLVYSIVSGDYISIAFGLLFIFIVYFVVAVFNAGKIKYRLLLLFPFTWPLFYFLVWVEYVVLFKSMIMILRGEEVEWQRWNRKGLIYEAS